MLWPNPRVLPWPPGCERSLLGEGPLNARRRVAAANHHHRHHPQGDKTPAAGGKAESHLSFSWLS